MTHEIRIVDFIVCSILQLHLLHLVCLFDNIADYTNDVWVQAELLKQLSWFLD